MNAYVALLRAVNVGGTGKLPMAELVRMGERAGFDAARTFIASGNLLFHSAKSERFVRAALAAELERYAGKPIDVVVRNAAQMRAVADANPFAKEPGNRTVAIFLDAAPAADALSAARGRVDEHLRIGVREIYVYYPRGLAETKLVIPAAAHGTARNMNTVVKLAEMSVLSSF